MRFFRGLILFALPISAVFWGLIILAVTLIVRAL